LTRSGVDVFIRGAEWRRVRARVARLQDLGGTGFEWALFFFGLAAAGFIAIVAVRATTPAGAGIPGDLDATLIAVTVIGLVCGVISLLRGRELQDSLQREVALLCAEMDAYLGVSSVPD
jgi:hypothetical protein